MRGEIVHKTRWQAILDAMSQLAFIGVPDGAPPDAKPSPIRYRLEPGFNGGSNPRASTCGHASYGNRVYTSDCIGLVLWALGIDRLQPGYAGLSGEWLNCKAINHDARTEKRFFSPVPDDEAFRGDCLVNDSHIGLILRPARGEYDHLVVDCSPRHGRATAIGVGGPWSDDCVVVRYRLFVDG